MLSMIERALVSSFLTSTVSKVCSFVDIHTNNRNLSADSIIFYFLCSVASLRNKMDWVSASEKEFVGNLEILLTCPTF